jgi:hypothetical protein
MVRKKEKIYLVENDHRFQEYCEENGFTANNVPIDNFIDVAKEIGWAMTTNEFEMHHNTRTLPTHYFMRIKDN